MDFVGTKEAAKMLGVSKHTLINLIESGVIRHIKLPKGKYLVDVKDFLKRNIIEPKINCNNNN